MSFFKENPLVQRITAVWRRGSGFQSEAEGSTTETSPPSSTFQWYLSQLKISRKRKDRYADFERMDEEYPEIASALDLYADNATAPQEKSGDTFVIESDNDKVVKILEDCSKRLKLDEGAWEIARNIAKYGDEFDEVIVSNQNAIVKLKYLAPETMVRKQDEYGRDEEVAYEQVDPKVDQVVAEFAKWQIVQFSNARSRKKYGRSILDSIRRPYKQLQMMEDGMVIARLTRSHLRYKWLVDITGMDLKEAEAHLKKVKKSVRKKRTINPITGKQDITTNPLTAEEDFFVGVTKDSPADVDVLQGQANLSNIGDVEHFQNKIFSGLKVPKAYLGLERDINAKATLTEQDIQFARTVRKVQGVLREGFRKIFDLELILKGIIVANVEYKVVFSAISMVDEMRKWQVEKIKAEVARIYGVEVDVLSDEFILSTFLGLSDEEIKTILKAREKEEPAPQPAVQPGLKLVSPGPQTKLPQEPTKTPKKKVPGEPEPPTPQAAVPTELSGQIKENGVYASEQLVFLVEQLQALVDAELESLRSE